ncbi:MAG: cytochrome P450, partial [Candidatus Competibacteraceae bacterium]|nr:cytochrome P450 [Candidatus Competibacteraceae bacterium]
SVFLLVRKTLTADALGGAVVPAGTQVIIHNGFNHRDGERLDWADRFRPDFWLERQGDWRFNHLSNGPQDCAGRELALFIAKAALARLLAGGRVELVGPKLDPNRPLPQAYNHFNLVLALNVESPGS